MMVCLITAAAAIVLAVAAFVYLVILFLSDADVLLIFKTKYGKQPGSLAGKVVWITGAFSGTGESMAYCLAEAGCKLVLSARRQEELERVTQACLTSSELLSSGKSKVLEKVILVLPLDAVAFEAHKAAVQKVLEHFNKIDVLVNNVGRSQRAMWLEVDLQVDPNLFEVNVLGPVSLTQEVLPHMIERKQGHIVVMSSIAGKGYFECLRIEMAEHNIDVTMIWPGPIFLTAATGKPEEAGYEVWPETDHEIERG